MMHIKCLEWCLHSEHSVNTGNGWYYIGSICREEKRMMDWALENSNIRRKAERWEPKRKNAKEREVRREPWNPDKRFQGWYGQWSQIPQRILVKWRLKLSTEVDGENVTSEFCQSCWSGTAVFSVVAISHTQLEWADNRKFYYCKNSCWRFRFCHYRKFYSTALLWSVDHDWSLSETLV